MSYFTVLTGHSNDVGTLRSNSITAMNGHQTEVTQRKQPLSDYAKGYAPSRSVPEVNTFDLDDATRHSTELRRESRNQTELRHNDRRVSSSQFHDAPRGDDVINTNSILNSVEKRRTVGEQQRLAMSREAIDQSASEMQRRVMNTTADDERVRQGAGSSGTVAGHETASSGYSGQLGHLPRSVILSHV